MARRVLVLSASVGAGHLRAAQAVVKLGPGFVVVKKGEHGALLMHQSGAVALPAMPGAAAAGTPMMAGLERALATVAR